MINVLLIEDDKRIGSFISKGLMEHDYNVAVATTASDGIMEAMNFTFDVIILDIMLPDMPGFEVCKILRRRKNLTPIIILSALDSPEEKIEGLKAGADDYLSKPFLFDELLARLQAQIRRADFNKGIVDFQSYGGIHININEKNATRDGKPLLLSPLEYKLLLYLMRNRGKAITRTAIAQSVWNLDFDSNTNTVDVYINFLRKKIDKDFAYPLIHTVKGTGYMLKMKEDETER